jgi:hypothetical protein
VETMFPLWFCQKALLNILTEERCEKHRQYANANRQRREFLPGDIFVIRRQIQWDASTGRPAKLQMRAQVLTGCWRNRVRTAIWYSAYPYCRASIDVLENLKSSQLGVWNAFLLQSWYTKAWIHLTQDCCNRQRS